MIYNVWGTGSLTCLPVPHITLIGLIYRYERRRLCLCLYILLICQDSLAGPLSAHDAARLSEAQLSSHKP